MNQAKFKTKTQIIDELGIARATFYRYVKRLNLKVNTGLISPEEENKIRKAFGFPEYNKNEGNTENDSF